MIPFDAHVPVPPDLEGPRTRTSPHALVARIAAVLAAFLLISFLLLTGSRAAFSATTDTSSGTVTAASVSLTDNDSGAALFSGVGDLVPGADVERCIDVTYTGSTDPDAVLLYMPNAPAGFLGDYLDLTVELGDDTADPHGDCSNFVPSSTLYDGTISGFRTAHSSYANGLATWDPTSTSTRTFRFTLNLQDDQMAQGLSSVFGFTWETRTA